MNKVIPAGFGKRLLAFLLDMMLVGLLMVVIVKLLDGPLEGWLHLESLNAQYIEIGKNMGIFDATGKELPNLTQDMIKAFQEATSDIALQSYRANLILNIIGLTISGLVFEFIVPAIIGNGKTLGKLATRLKVVKLDGSKIGLLEIFLRGFVGVTLIENVLGLVLSMFPKLQMLAIFPFALSAVLVLSSNSKRAVHDYVSGTIVTYQDGFEPAVREDDKQYSDPYHKKTKGFEYIDLEALEERERRAQERMANNSQEQDNIVEDVKEEPVIDSKDKVNPINDITIDDIERKEQEALERIKNKENNK